MKNKKNQQISQVNQINVDEMIGKANKRTINRLANTLSYLENVKWKSVSFTIPTEPDPSHRPRRVGAYRMYVPGAAKHQKYFDTFVRPKLDGLFINTPCKIDVKIFCKTPTSFSDVQKILAEMGFIRPWANNGDVDNFLKSVMDQMQPNEKRGNVGIMSNDFLVIDSHAEEFYSVTPRYEVTLTYMVDIPDEIKGIMRIKEW